VRTWDGLPISEELPRGASIAIWRWNGTECEWLLLHRAHEGPEYDGDWAWTPPSGARLPGESIEECARRELREEAGLDVDPIRVDGGREDWADFVAEAPADVEIRLDAEHDRYEWLPLSAAVARCLPAVVAKQLGVVAAAVEDS
jgi:8-oxo-dGTP pyrophosphatase MutT (NUDIX family)